MTPTGTWRYRYTCTKNWAISYIYRGAQNNRLNLLLNLKCCLGYLTYFNHYIFSYPLIPTKGICYRYKYWRRKLWVQTSGGGIDLKIINNSLLLSLWVEARSNRRLILGGGNLYKMQGNQITKYSKFDSLKPHFWYTNLVLIRRIKNYWCY